MRIRTVKNPGLITAVEQTISASPQGEYHAKLFQALKDYDLYLYGGAIRDILSGIINRKKNKITDFDWLVDDNAKPYHEQLLKSFPGMQKNRFGNLKWVPIEGVEMDLIPFSKTHIVMGKKGEEQKTGLTIDDILLASDFTPNSAAYDLRRKVIHNYQAIQAINSRIFELNQHKDYDHVILAKIILQSEKLGCEIGPRAQQFIARKYSPELNKQIREYLSYKKKVGRYNHVISRLRNVQQEIKK